MNKVNPVPDLPFRFFEGLVPKVEFESWNGSAKSVRAATKKQLERANRSQFNGTGASSSVEAVNTWITATRTQKQGRFDDSIYYEYYFALIGTLVWRLHGGIALMRENGECAFMNDVIVTVFCHSCSVG